MEIYNNSGVKRDFEFFSAKEILDHIIYVR